MNDTGEISANKVESFPSAKAQFVAFCSLLGIVFFLPALNLYETNESFQSIYDLTAQFVPLLAAEFWLLPSLVLGVPFYFLARKSPKLTWTITLVTAAVMFASQTTQTNLVESSDSVKWLVSCAIVGSALLVAMFKAIDLIKFLTFIFVPLVIYAGYKGYKISHQISAIHRASAPALSPLDGEKRSNDVYVFMLDGSDITTSWLDEDEYPREDILPNLNAFVKNDFYWFPNTVTNGPQTYLSLSSMLTGKYYVNDKAPLLPRDSYGTVFNLTRNLYKPNLFFHANQGWIHCDNWHDDCYPFRSDFETNIEAVHALRDMMFFLVSYGLYDLGFVAGEENKGQEWRNRNPQFFSFLQEKPAGGSLYFAQIGHRSTRDLVYFDQLFGSFVRFLKNAGRYEKSVIAIISDHGFDFSAKSPYYGPSAIPNDRVFRVPFAIKPPSTGEGKLFETRAQNVDFAPTLAAVLVGTDKIDFSAFDGVNLLTTDPVGRPHLVASPSANTIRERVRENNLYRYRELSLDDATAKLQQAKLQFKER